ncbi:MAG TPA: DUF2155 domain-containing protein [Caulobacteraceae bacterium]
MAAGRLLTALIVAFAAAAPVQARQAEAEPAAPLPSAPIPYNQLNRPRVTAVPQVELPAEDEKPDTPEEPLKRPRANVAILQALDKITTETLRFEAQVGKPVRYKNLIFTVRACETAAADEPAPEATAYVIIDSAPRRRAGGADLPGRQLFRGWMFASSPSLNPLEHPVYDAWLIACRTATPSPVNR